MSEKNPVDPAALPDLGSLPLMGSTAPATDPADGPQAHRLAGPPPAASTTDPAVEDAEPESSTASAPPAASPLLDYRDDPADPADYAPLDPTPTELDEVDWGLVRQLRRAIADNIVNALDADATDPTRRGLDRERDTPLARRLLREEIQALQHQRATVGQAPLTGREVIATTSAVLDSLFGIGRLQRFLDDPGLEDILVRGADNVWLIYADGRKVRGPAAADSDEDLIEDIRQLAANAAGGERPFNEGMPRLNMALGDQGHRLSASMSFTHRPTMTIRRQGYRDITLDQMVEELHALDSTLAAFLAAAIRAGKNIVVSGLPSAGKTTMIRALLNVLDPTVAIGTIETEYELALHHMPDRHPMVWPAQYRPGGEDGAGEVTLFDLMVEALRQSVDRIVVGEVRGPEILVMFDAMQAGKGAVTTIHATSARATIDRIVNCALKQPQTSAEWAYREAAEHIDLIVNLGVLDETPIGGRKLRFVREVTAVEANPDAAQGVAFTDLFTPGSDGRAVPTGNTPRWIDDAAMYGFDPALLTARVSDWRAPLDTLDNRAQQEAS